MSHPNLYRRLRRRTAIRLIAASIVPFVGGLDNRVCAAAPTLKSLDGVIGITAGGALEILRDLGEVNLATLANYVHDELGLELIDLNTRWTNSVSSIELQRVREQAESIGCYFTNLKVNHEFGDLYSIDSGERSRAMTAGRDLIDTAKCLGARWIRFVVPKSAAARPTSHIELAKYAQQQNVGLLVENNQWIGDEPNAIAEIVQAIGLNAASCPDTGNWKSDEIRIRGLKRSFTNAASCDFKVFELDALRHHPTYDLKQCFDIGWDAGFRGPWVIEIITDETAGMAADVAYIRDLLHDWIDQRNTQSIEKMVRPHR